MFARAWPQYSQPGKCGAFLWNEHPPNLWWSTLQEINCRERESWDCAIQSQLHRKYLLPALHCHATNYIHYRHYILLQITFTTFSSTLSHRLHSLLCAIRNHKVNGTKNIHDADDKVKDQDSLSDKQLSSFLTGAVHHPWKLLWWSGRAFKDWPWRWGASMLIRMSGGTKTLEELVSIMRGRWYGPVKMA